MRFLILQWYAWIGRVSPNDCLGPPFSSGMAGPHSFSFIHSWTISRHAAHELERKALTAVAGPAGAAASNLLVQLKLQLMFLVTILAAATQAFRDSIAIIKSMPRTARVFLWAVRAGMAYKQLMSAHADHESDSYVEQLVALHLVWAANLAAVCRANGGVYVKFGQFAAAFGAVPREYRMILAQLEDKARPRPYREISKVLLAELGCKPSSLVGDKSTGAVFAEFEENATAAASLAQVHRAKLASGEEVAVKLQYPNLRSEVRADLRVMKVLATMAAAVFPEFSLGWMYDELKDKLQIELDFRNEIHNANQLRSLFVGSRITACVPVVHQHLSTQQMIIMEWIQGTKITDVPELQRQQINPRAVGMALAKVFAEMTFIHGYIHGDPHPGNLMVRPKGRPSFWNSLFRGTKQRFDIVLLDHGSYLTLSKQLREQFCQLWCSFVTKSKGVQVEVSTALAGERAGKVLPVLLTHQAKTRKEEQALQRSVGINCFGDMTVILSSAPRDLVELLRINTVIRASTNVLGVTMDDRKRIYAWFARRGLPPRRSRDPHVHASSGSLLYRARLLLLLSVWTSWCMGKSAVRRSWGFVLSTFADVLYND